MRTCAPIICLGHAHVRTNHMPGRPAAMAGLYGEITQNEIEFVEEEKKREEEREREGDGPPRSAAVLPVTQ